VPGSARETMSVEGIGQEHGASAFREARS